MKDSKGNTLCVVAGGDYGTCILDTVEILDTSRIDEGYYLFLEGQISGFLEEQPAPNA